MSKLRSRTAVRQSARGGASAIALLCGSFVLTLILGIVPGVSGTAVSAALPWLGLLIIPLAVAAIAVARRTLPLVLVAALAWVWTAYPSFPAAAHTGSSAALVVASQNVHSDSESARESAQTLLTSDPDVVVFTELPPERRWPADEELAARLPHRLTVGTLSVWSVYPLHNGVALDLGLGWKRALRVTVATPDGDVALYGVHAASVRVGRQSERDHMLRALGSEIRSDTSKRVVVVGDFNAASTDPALTPVRDSVRWVAPSDGTWGLSWPASFPLVRLDHVFARGLGASTATIRAGSSDHLATLTTLYVD